MSALAQVPQPFVVRAPLPFAQREQIAVAAATYLDCLPALDYTVATRSVYLLDAVADSSFVDLKPGLHGPVASDQSFAEASRC